MKRRLLDSLICPSCLPDEHSLESSVQRETEDEIIEGELICPHCDGRFPIERGVALLLPAPETPFDSYDDARISQYLWSHYADLWNDPDILPSYAQWAAFAPESSGWGLDIGCAVGRMTFELAAKTPFTVGIDRSIPFVHSARHLLCHGRTTVALKCEGELFAEREVVCNESWRRDAVEFIVADAMALPFRRGGFGIVSSLNLLDRIHSPLRHLHEVDRVARESRSTFIVSDPFSWSTEYTTKNQWLGGRRAGEFAGKGIANLKRSLEERRWSTTMEGDVWWKIRNHRNHFELIRSEYLVVTR